LYASLSNASFWFPTWAGVFTSGGFYDHLSFFKKVLSEGHFTPQFTSIISVNHNYGKSEDVMKQPDETKT
jgi:hypothetical protein